jgi:hypothetical protein
MGRHDVPAEHVFFEVEFAQRRADDRRGRLGEAATSQLSLGGERQAADPGAAIARRLADEQEPGALAGDKVVRETTPKANRRVVLRDRS